MRLPLVAVAAAFASASALAGAKLPPLRDPVFMNIGFVCQWQESCIERQKRAYKRALSYVRKANPPTWKIELCNHRAAQRRSGRVDWISFNHCIKNPKVQRSSAIARRSS